MGTSKDQNHLTTEISHYDLYIYNAAKARSKLPKKYRKENKYLPTKLNPDGSICNEVVVQKETETDD